MDLYACIILIVGGALAITSVNFGFNYWADRSSIKSTGHPVKVIDSLSWPSRQIVKKHHQIPLDRRPDVDLISVLRAIDVKSGEGVDDHYKSAYYYDGPSYAWCRCDNSRCPYPEYWDIYTEVRDTVKAVQNQEHQLKIAGINGSLEDVTHMLEDLRSTRKQITEETDYITKGELSP
jgi:hypothetical protein